MNNENEPGSNNIPMARASAISLAKTAEACLRERPIKGKASIRNVFRRNSTFARVMTVVQVGG